MTEPRKPPVGLTRPVFTSTSTSGSAASSPVSRDGNAREFQFSNADFERIRKLIYQHAGISLSPVKQDMVYSRLARRLASYRDEDLRCLSGCPGEGQPG